MDDVLHPDLEALVGTIVHGRYRVDALLGVGGMGAVFKGHHTGLDRDVAIKVLHPDIGRDRSIGKRFEREATSASRLDHPNCVRVTDFGTTETGVTYLVMELLEGSELADKLGTPWPAVTAIETAKQILAGLEHAHHFGIVHRDLKPENVFVTKDYRGHELVKLVDFGIAKLIDEQGVEKLTRQGVVFGTPRYMSPEQAAGGKLDERTDLYAAGLILYEMLAGRPPFDADDAATLLRMQIMAPPPALPPSVPAALVEIVNKLLEKSKTDRYANAREVIDALEAAEQLIGGASTSAAAAVVPIAAVAGSGAVSTVPTAPQAGTATLQTTGPTTPARANPHAGRSGASWQPAGASTPTGSHQTLAYMPATHTGSHASVGQPATGSFETLPSSSRATAIDPTASMSIAVHDQPPERRVGVWIGGAVAVLIVCIGIGAAVAFFSQPSPAPTDDTNETAPAIGDEPSEPAPAAVSPDTDSPTRLEPSPSPAPAPKRGAKRTPSSIWSVVEDDDKRENTTPPANDDDTSPGPSEKQGADDPAPTGPSERDASDPPSGEPERDAPAGEPDGSTQAEESKTEIKGKGKGRGKGKDK